MSDTTATPHRAPKVLSALIIIAGAIMLIAGIAAWVVVATQLAADYRCLLRERRSPDTNPPELELRRVFRSAPLIVVIIH
ncbi:hypothetical protein [Microbacterium amylolyticum]|uniref:Uncharacterized protein n=1 Tax=Microbacterium amylolyticum TaxID=936337 RepID=A0ABS4ZIF6_9MICO|nr:hypothetical protein [Microbacterium amylolyticum]MBP2436982.1 hypothetical protein [Microbacterium amylolyticum]